MLGENNNKHHAFRHRTFSRWLSYLAPLVTDFTKIKMHREKRVTQPREWHPRSGEEPEGNIDLGVTPPYEFCSLVKDALVRQDLANSDRIKYTWFHFSDRLLCCQADVSNMTWLYLEIFYPFSNVYYYIYTYFPPNYLFSIH